MSEVVSTKGSLVMIGLNTDKPQVYFNGSEITGVIGLNVVNNKRTQTVVSFGCITRSWCCCCSKRGLIMHSRFLFIIPEDWLTLEGDQLDALDVNVVINHIANGTYVDLTDRMRLFGYLTEDQTVQEARVFESVIMAYRV
jgi:hypothetical protein